MKALSIPLFCISLAATALCHGATLYTNGSPGSPANAFYSDPDAGAWQASRFTLGSDVNITTIVIDGFYTSPSAVDHFNITVMADGALPGGVVQSAANVTATRTNISGNFYQFTLSIPDAIQLNAGTYWLSIANVAGEGDLWGWATSAGAGVAAGSIVSQTGGYTTNGTKLFSYSLQGSVVPEASTALLGLAGGGLLLRRRRSL